MEQSHWISNYVFPYLNLLIFLVILVFFARKPLSEIARKRKTDFEDFSKSATQALAQAKQQLAELNNQHQRLEQEVKEIKARAHREAEAEANKIIEEGRRIAKQIVDDAMRISSVEYQMAQRQLENEAVQAAKQAIIRKVTSDFKASHDEAFIEDQIKELASLTKVAEGVMP